MSDQEPKRGCLWWIGLAVVVVVAIALLDSIDDDEPRSRTDTAGERQASIDDDVTLESCGLDDIGFMAAEISVVNDSSDRSDYLVEVVFESPDGSEQLATGRAHVSSLGPGQTAKDSAESYTRPDGEFTCKVIDVSRSASR